MAQTVTLWGVVSKDGVFKPQNNCSSGVQVARADKGRYQITFTPPFQYPPAIVGSPTDHEKLNENTRDNVVFPHVTVSGALALTGDQYGDKKDRDFSFIAIGFMA
jgi:hypothetical protein